MGALGIYVSKGRCRFTIFVAVCWWIAFIVMVLCGKQTSFVLLLSFSGSPLPAKDPFVSQGPFYGLWLLIVWIEFAVSVVHCPLIIRHSVMSHSSDYWMVVPFHLWPLKAEAWLLEWSWFTSIYIENESNDRRDVDLTSQSLLSSLICTEVCYWRLYLTIHSSLLSSKTTFSPWRQQTTRVCP